MFKFKEYQNDFTTRNVLELSYKHRLSHIGSSLSILPALEDIFLKKKDNSPVVLSCGHAGVGLYSFLEYWYGCDAEQMFLDFGIHPCRDVARHIHVSSGSLGSAITIAVGMALADRTRNVYCVISDGECAEGSVWESLAFAQKINLTNLKVYVIVNGYSAYGTVNINNLVDRINTFFPAIILESKIDFPPLEGLAGHYHVLTEEEYNEAIK